MSELVQHRLSVNTLRRIDAACDRFEEAWRGGRQPRIEEYLSSCEVVERSPLLDALQQLQQELILNQLPPTGVGPVTTVLPVQERPAAPSLPARIEPIPQPAATAAAVIPGDGTSARVTLRVIAGPHAGQEFTYAEHDTLFAGRLSEAQLRLENDLHFSRHHFRLEVNPPTCFLLDLNSRNGTFVNGEQVTERFLKDGDVVSGGRTKMVVSVFDPRAMPSKSSPQPVPNVAPAARATPLAAKSSSGKEAAPSIRIAGYQIHQQLGSGDLGTVYHATRLSSGEPCALKVIAPAEHADELSIQTFLREAKILNQLQHPHIVRFIDMGASGHDVFLATEYLVTVPWERVVARCSTEKRIRLACGLIGQILGALEYAHARSLVHRDVKPGNILISKKDGKLIAKLADFGLAKQDTTAGMSQITRDGDVIGSLPFMSPDQFMNSREARPTCDLYSLGATLYWMLAGHAPIPLENHPCKFLAILQDPPTPLQQHTPTVPAALAQLVHRALEKTPEKRFASAAEMRQQLRAFIR